MSLKELNKLIGKDLKDLSSFHVFPGPKWHTLTLDEQAKMLMDGILRIEEVDTRVRWSEENASEEELALYNASFPEERKVLSDKLKDIF